MKKLIYFTLIVLLVGPHYLNAQALPDFATAELSAVEKYYQSLPESNGLQPADSTFMATANLSWLKNDTLFGLGHNGQALIKDQKSIALYQGSRNNHNVLLTICQPSRGNVFLKTPSGYQALGREEIGYLNGTRISSLKFADGNLAILKLILKNSGSPVFVLLDLGKKQVLGINGY